MLLHPRLCDTLCARCPVASLQQGHQLLPLVVGENSRLDGHDSHSVTLWLAAGSCSWCQAMLLPISAQEEQLPNGRPWLGEQHAADDHSGDEAPVNDGLQSSARAEQGTALMRS